MRRSLLIVGALLFASTLAIAVAANYERSIANVLISEGGSRYTNHAADPGGPTKYGITIYDVRLYLKSDATAADVKALTEAQARDIYRKRYWDALRGDDLPIGLDYSVVDYGVNSGIARAGKILRRALDMETDTWRVTDEVIEEIAKRDPKELIRAVNDERLRFLKGLKTWRVFGTGWSRRVASVRAISLTMAGVRGLRGGATMAPAFGPGKAFDGDDRGEP